MKAFAATLLVLAAATGLHAADPAPIQLFDGRSFAGWNGDTNKSWRIEDGSLAAGSTSTTFPRNEFLATDRSFTNFVLKLQFKLTGTEGFVNSGVQIRSERAKDPANEMVGYQLDIGDPTWWGCIYDESRRNKVLAASDMKTVGPALKRQDWNAYVIRAEGPRVQAWINGVQTVDYTEPDAAIVQSGKIGLQIHGGGKAEIRFKDITVQPLP
jgi:hypothetical protein